MSTSTIVQAEADVESNEKIMTPSEKLLDAAMFKPVDEFVKLLVGENGVHVRVLRENSRLALDVHGAIKSRQLLAAVQQGLLRYTMEMNLEMPLQIAVHEMRQSLFANPPKGNKWFHP